MTRTRESCLTDSRPLEGKVALVTGGGVRIGAALSEALAKNGATVLIHHNRSHDEARRVQQHIARDGGSARLLEADFAAPSEVESLLRHDAVGAAGRVDILVNNASTYPHETWSETGDPLLHHTLQVNAWAPLALMRGFIAGAPQDACIINILDTHLHALTREKFAYQLSKHALSFLTRYAALAGAPRVRVNAIAPGAILPPPGEDEAYLDRLGETLPLRRHGGTQDAVDAALFLIRSPFVTGATIEVDGGEHLLGAHRA